MDTKIKPMPANIDGYSWRPMTRADAPAMLRWYIAMDEADGTNYAADEDDILRDMDDPSGNLETDTLLALTPQGDVAALGWVFSNPEATHERRSFLFGGVHPAHRRRGLGSALFPWQEARGTEMIAGYDDGLPKGLRCNSPSTVTGRIRLIESRGFSVVRNFYRMERDLNLPVPEIPSPEGVSLHAFLPERSDDILQANNEAFEDHWGHEPMPQEMWNLWFVNSPALSPEFCVTALAGDEVAGGLICTVNEGGNQIRGIRQGWINLLFVRRPWRGKGLGSAMLSRNMRLLKDAGFTSAGLNVDTENLTGALRIYENMDFVPVFKSIAFNKAIE